MINTKKILLPLVGKFNGALKSETLNKLIGEFDTAKRILGIISGLIAVLSLSRD